MSTNLKHVSQSLLCIVLTRKFLLAIVLAVLLISTVATVYASQIFWEGTGTDQYGNTTEYFLSCGSSAGNYFCIAAITMATAPT